MSQVQHISGSTCLQSFIQIMQGVWLLLASLQECRGEVQDAKQNGDSEFYLLMVVSASAGTTEEYMPMSLSCI
jgi:hypothetical protein